MIDRPPQALSELVPRDPLESYRLMTPCLQETMTASNASSRICRICQNVGPSEVYRTQEMMFGYRDTFTYFQCSCCGCLQIETVPADMAKYYPPAYYSLAPATPQPTSRGVIARTRAALARKRDRYALFRRGLLGALLFKSSPDDSYRSVSDIGLTMTSRVLDVGCGSGERLLALQRAGLRCLLGVDAFVDSDIVYPNGVHVRNGTIHDIDDIFDVIMFHHSFEHLSDPLATIQSVARIMAPDGVCLIRTPTVSSYAWEHYRERWVQLDPPRHFFVHSLESMRQLASHVGLRVERTVYDSTAFQFWGSEQYMNDIPLHSERSHLVNPKNSMFSAHSILQFGAAARRLNAQGRGDQAAFYLTR
jgi:SAM-dependent methyltransferase